MGAWGTGILDNDLAEDLKEQWVEYLSEGYAPDEVSAHMIEAASEEGMLEDVEEQYEFLLPFALIQWKTGRLQDDIKEQALKLLEEENVNQIEGSKWDEPKDLKNRLVALQELRSTLLSTQPKPTRIKKPYRQTTSLNQGDLFTILLKSGNYVLLEVVEIHGDLMSNAPICFLYKYMSPTIPSSELADTLDFLEFDSEDPFDRGSKYSRIALVAFNKKSNEPSDRIIILQEHRSQKNNRKTAMRMCEWSQIDTCLEKWLTTNGS